MRAVSLRVATAAVVALFLADCSVEPESPLDLGGEAPPAAADERRAELVAQAGLAQWSNVVALPLVPVSAANLPDGTILLWSAEDRFGFGNDTGRTYTATFDPASGVATERLVSETGHDMFCPGTANLADGRILVNGGLSAPVTSVFDPATGVWSRGANMTIPRAYQGTTALADGAVLTLGGSWAGGVGNKHGERWTEAGGWRRLPGVPIDPFLSVDPTRNFGMDSHLWLIAAGNGRVFHAGPGMTMHWVDTQGEGRVLPAGRRGDDEFSVNGSAVLFDRGRVLKVGGGPGYDSVNANANAYVIELEGGVNVRKVGPMAYRRAFHNVVVLPNGQVVVLGGNTFAVGFSDNNSVLAPELFDPATETFVALPPMSVPRNYHSVALLLPDGRVLSAGGGLCGFNCAANHPDLQILSPPYLFAPDGTPAPRPVIASAPAQANHGTSMAVATDSPVASFALVRAASTTHAVNNDQRRLVPTFRATGANAYEVDIPSNPGWAVPGLYMLFALNEAGVPSVARTVRVGAASLLRVLPVDDQTTTRGAAAALSPPVSNPAAAPLSFAAQGLPPGLSIDPLTGAIAGTPSSTGRFLVELSVSDGAQTVSTTFPWVVNEPGTTRYVLFEALSEIAGNPWASAAEFDLLDDNGEVLSRGGWAITADSADEAIGHGAERAIDGDPATFWRTESPAVSPPHPHHLRIDLRGTFRVAGFRYLPRQDASNDGNVANYRVSLSADGSSWGAPVATGDLRVFGATKAEKVVYFDNLALGKAASQSSTAPGGPAALAVDGGYDGVFANGSVSHTNADPNAYWEVDLGASYQTFGVRLWNRTDCCSNRLRNFYLLAADSPMAGRTLAELIADPGVSMAQVAGQAAPTQLFALSSRARYVRVQLGSTDVLHLAEVEVYGRPATNRAPVLVPPAPGPLVIGSPASYALQASDPDGDPLTFSATGLPPGLSLDAATGVITGAVATGGSYPVVVQVDDGRGGSASASFAWFVGLPPPAVEPVASPLAAVGATVTYQASASGAGALLYQWNFGDGTGDTGFSGASSASHAFAGPGVYTVTLTVQNPDGSATARQFWQAVAGPVVAGRPRASSPLALATTPAGARLWAVNPDNDSVSVFDAAALTKLAEIAVAAGPRSVSVAPDGRVWVSGARASALSVISPDTLAVEQTVALPRAAQPHGVVHGADGSAYVALDALGRVLKLSGAGEPGASVEVGANPRELALSAAGDRLLVARFITGFQPGEATADVLPFVGAEAQGGAVLLVDPSAMTVTRAVTLRHGDKPDTTVSGRGVPNYLGAPAIAPDGASAWVPSKQDNVQRGLLRDGRNLDFQNTVRAISSRIDLGAEAEDYPARVDHDNAGLASAALYHPSGVYLFVALETSRQVAVVDAYGARELFRLDVGRAPQGLALSDDGRTLFVHNFMDRAVSVHPLARLLDFGEPAAVRTATLDCVASERLAPAVLRGKQLFYDARDTRLARDAYLSCAACHRDGGHDGRTWDFTDAGEGLRNTVSLRGRGGAPGRLHWSANFDEGQDFEAQIRALNQGTGLMSDAALATGTRAQPLGDPKAGVSADLDALAAYLDSLTSVDDSPHRPAPGALTPEAAAGRVVFASQCARCHGGADFSDSGSLSLHDVGTLKASSGERLGAPLTGLDTPTLRDAWATAPYLHDGSAPTLEAAIDAHANLSLPAAERDNVAAFVRQLGGEEPAVAPPRTPGLSAQYFANRTLAGAPALTRLENVDFNWGQGAPAPGLPANDFSVRWAGQLVAPTAGVYRLRTVSDDGVRVRVNGNLVINRWTDHGPTTDTSAPLVFSAGQHVDLSVEYYERGGGAVVSLSWLVPGATTYAVVPADQLTQSGGGLTGQYFANDALTGEPSLTRTENVDFAWADASPAPGLPADHVSARWVGQLLAPASGTYRLRTLSDEGVRLWLNGSLLVDNWSSHPLTADLSAALGLSAGERYDVVLECRELEGPATMQLQWLTPGASAPVAIPAARLYAGGTGLQGRYYANPALSGPPVLTRVEGVDFDWGPDAPGAGLPADNFSARWAGRVRAPRSGTYRFQTLSDDGVRVWVDGALIIDNWTPHAPTLDTSATLALVAGQRYDVTVEYQEFGGGATIQLRWQTPNAPGFVAVPKRALDGF